MILASASQSVAALQQGHAERANRSYESDRSGLGRVDVYRHAVDYAIAYSAKSADLAVQAPTKYELVLNLKTAKVGARN